MIVTVALFALFTVALGAGMLVLADTVIRGRNAYRVIKGAATARPSTQACAVIRPAPRLECQPALQMKLAA